LFHEEEKDVQGARLVDQFECRRSERADIMATTRMHKLVLALLFTAITELAPSGFREIATAHGMVILEEDGRWVEIESSRASLKLVRLVPVTSERETVGVIAIFDDPMTPGRDSYWELRDMGDQIVAISWIDRFGIRRLTLDRGFLDGTARLEGNFVTLVNGESI
jgi:hypothetical protein